MGTGFLFYVRSLNIAWTQQGGGKDPARAGLRACCSIRPWGCGNWALQGQSFFTLCLFPTKFRGKAHCANFPAAFPLLSTELGFALIYQTLSWHLSDSRCAPNCTHSVPVPVSWIIQWPLGKDHSGHVAEEATQRREHSGERESPACPPAPQAGGSSMELLCLPQSPAGRRGPFLPSNPRERAEGAPRPGSAGHTATSSQPGDTGSHRRCGIPGDRRQT